jgi:ribonucleotide reductase beta subunit family protein with ferritin-like domain
MSSSVHDSTYANDVEDLFGGEDNPLRTRTSLLIEPLCDPDKYAYFTDIIPVPNEDLPIYNSYLEHRRNDWSHLHTDMSLDATQWTDKKVIVINGMRYEVDLISDNEKFFLKNTLAYFLVGDFEVNDNEKSKLMEITNPWYRIFLNDKIAREDVHNLSYNLMVQGLISSPSEREQVRKSIKNSDVVQDKIKWLRRYIVNGTLAEKEAAGACTEGIFFSSSFASIYWYKIEKKLLPGICSFNEYIARDEKLHMEVACKIYQTRIVNKLPREQLKQMIEEAVDIETRFACQSLPVDLIGMKKEEMWQYIRYVADYLWMLLTNEEEGIYNVENPYDFMAFISVNSVADFFSQRVTAYNKGEGVVETSEMLFSCNADF